MRQFTVRYRTIDGAPRTVSVPAGSWHTAVAAVSYLPDFSHLALMTMADLTFDAAGWRNFWAYYKDDQHQRDAIEILRQHILESDPSLLTDGAEWVQAYRAKPAAGRHTNPLAVPYFSQNDNASGTGYRECFSSSCAMVAAYYGKISSDDAYNTIRAKYGDSTSCDAQIRALRELGLKATFHTDGTPDVLKNLLDAGIPVPCGWLHHGSVSSPSGGGHYSVTIGYTGDSWIVNDPNGEANLYAGGYTPRLYGAKQHYSFQNWNPRWECDGHGTGWYMRITE